VPVPSYTLAVIAQGRFRCGRGEEGDTLDPKEKEELLTTEAPFGDRLNLKLASQLVALARSPNSEDIDLLIKIGMTSRVKTSRT
jgi:hypothetical protein